MTKFLKINYILLISFVLLIATAGRAQVAINTSGAAADASAILDISSTSKGFLLPRMTTGQRDAIASPAEGLMIFNTTTHTLNLRDNSTWTIPPGGFLCGTSRVQDIDGNLINTRQIGDQCWLASNLNTGIRIESSADPSDNGVIERYCYNDEDDSCAVYGGLYKWDEVMQYRIDFEGIQGICPSGWRIPTVQEAIALITALGGYEGAAPKLKEAGSNHWCPSNDANNSSGFTAYGGGYFTPAHTFSGIRTDTKFWTTFSDIIVDVRKASNMILECESVWAGITEMETTYGFAVRCIRSDN